MALRQGIAETAEAQLIAALEGRENVVFLAPMGAHGNVAVEAWQVMEQWDLQTDDEDVVHAVRYGVPEGDPEQTQTLANLEDRIETAAGSDDFADDRIENVDELDDYYEEIGAYGDITPDDGETATFTPAQPPPVLTCASGTAVADPGVNRGLVHDCEALLAAKDTLRGTGSLDWSAETAITGWEGVTTSGTPSRVTSLELSSEGLTGSIPAELGRLFELTVLDLSSNALTGDIPSELGLLFNLTEVRLSGNQLTGCIPVALEDVATNDLSSLNLLYCAPPAPEDLSAGTPGEFSIDLSWDATVDDDTITGTSHTVDGLACESSYHFQVSAYGSGTIYAAAWSEPSAVASAATTACVSPVFALGTVSATDPNGDTVTYAITAGNDDGMFAIGASTGTLTVVGELDYDTTTLYTLTVAAQDGVGHADTSTVRVTVRERVPVNRRPFSPKATAPPGPSRRTPR